VVRLTSAELAATMRVSTRTVARWRAEGCPYSWAGAYPRYDLAAVEAWNNARHACPSTPPPTVALTPRCASSVDAFTAAFRRVQLRVTPSS
jgi:hypothetical protein